MKHTDARVSPEQIAYAKWLDWGTRAGIVLLVATFCAYALEFASPKIPFALLKDAWGLPLAEYRAATGAPDGWYWLPLAGHGDFMNLLGVAVVALVTPACYLRILPLLLERGERAYALVAMGEIIVLLTAAAGLIGAGH